MAGPGDIAEIFGKDEKGFFVIGYTREQEHPVRINLEKFVQRSSGVFGATGTGKSFLTRLVLAGLIHDASASVLVFDMHNEYGLDDTASDTGQNVIGLRSAFGRSKVQIVGLGGETTIRSISPDFNRRREELEGFTLDAIRMVGILEQSGVTWGLVKTKEGTIHRVKTGNYMGQNHGRINQITEDKIELTEIVQDGTGGYSERQASLALAE